MVRSGLKIRPKYEAYFIRQPIEGICFTKNVHNYTLKKKICLKFPEFRIRIPDPDYMFSGFFEIFESLSDMVHS